MKKIASIVLSCIIILNLVLPINADVATQTIVSQSDNAVVVRWQNEGVIRGYKDGSFKPDSLLTRGEMAQILANLFVFEQSDSIVTFKDVKKTDWYANAVNSGVALNIISGYPDGTFRGSKSITKEQAVVLLYNAFKMNKDTTEVSQFKDASSVSSYAKKAVLYFETMGYIQANGDGLFLPQAPITRIEILTLIDLIVDLYCNEDNEIIENATARNALIVAKNVTLKNVQINQSLFVAESVGESDVTLTSVNVKGTSFISGGGSNSVHIKDSKLGLVVTNKVSGKILRVIVEGNSTVEAILAKNSIILEDTTESSGLGILKVTLSKDIKKEAIVKLIGRFLEVVADADDVDIQLEGLITQLLNNGFNVSLNGLKINAGLSKQLSDLLIDDEAVAAAQPGNNSNNNGNNNNGNSNNNKVWTMSWNDEFTGNTIDTSKWTYDLGNWIVDESGTGIASGWGNNEKEFYTNSSDNAYVKAGKLVIEAKKEVTTDQFGTYDYTSAKLKTKGLFSQTYGRYEIKAKLPVGKGLWPAIWMLPENDTYGGWAASGEIDIAEGWGSKPDAVGGTLHYGGVWPNNKYIGKTYTFSQNTSVNQFHEYALEWEPGEIRWYIDGVLYQTQNNWYNKDSNDEKYAFPAPFDQDFYMILNLAVGGNFDGDPTADTQFPCAMEVDYVRVYTLTGRDYLTPTEPLTLSEPLPSGAKVPTADGNLLTDGSFNQPIQNNFDGSLDFSDKWNLVSIGDFGGSATQSIDTIDGVNYAKVDITNSGNQSYSVQLIQTTTIGKGRYYKVSFDAKSTTDRNINMKVGGGADVGYAVYSESYTLGLTSSMQHFEKIFQMNGDTNLNTRLELNLGLNTNPVWIGNVRLEEVDAPAKDYNATKVPLANGNGVYNSTFDKETVNRMAYWNFSVEATATATGTVAENTREFYANILNGGTDAKLITLDQQGIQLEKNSDYKLTFNARSTDMRDINVALHSKDGTVSYLESSVIALDTSMKTYVIDFRMNEETDLESQLVFELGGSDADVYIDAVSLKQTSIDYSSIDVYPLKNGDFSNGLASWANYVDWSAGAVISNENGEVKVAIDHVGPETWGVQLYQGTFEFSNKVDYIVAFDVKSTVDRNLEIVIDNAGYYRYLSKTVAATSDYTHYEYTLKIPADDTVSLKFLLGKTDMDVTAIAHDLFIDNVVCQVKNAPPAPTPAGLAIQRFDSASDLWTGWWGDEWSGYGSGTVDLVNGEMVADVTVVGGASYAPQLFKEGIKLENGKSYIVSFDVKADADRQMNVNIGKALSTDPWFTSYAPTKVVDITTTTQTISYDFTVSAATDENLKMVFELGTIAGQSIATKVIFDNISIIEGSISDPVVGGITITNGTFDTDTTGWNLYGNDGSNATIAQEDGKLKVTFPDYAGWFKWSTQVYQNTINLEAGTTYSLSFDVSGSTGRDIWVEMTDMAPQTVSITADTQHVSVNFTATNTVANGKINFLLGTENMDGALFVKNQIMYLDNISIVEN